MNQIANPGANPSFDKQLSASKTFMAQEDSVIDKLFARKDVERIYNLQKKKRLEEGELNELLHLLTAVEPKLLNFDNWLHYAMTHFIVALRGEVAKTIKFWKIKNGMEEAKGKGKVVTDRALALFDESFSEQEEQMKFIIDIFCYAGRASMSLSALAFKEFVRAQWEYEYGQRMKQMGFLERNIPQLKGQGAN